MGAGRVMITPLRELVPGMPTMGARKLRPLARNYLTTSCADPARDAYGLPASAARCAAHFGDAEHPGTYPGPGSSSFACRTPERFPASGYGIGQIVLDSRTWRWRSALALAPGRWLDGTGHSAL